MPSYKLIVLDEADSMTGDAQAALRRIMENYSKATRFCLICNYVSRIIEPLASRCAKFRFRPLAADAVEGRLAHVAREENVTIDAETLVALRSITGGDMRKAITLMQSAHMLLGERLDAAGVSELAGVVPDARIDTLYALTCAGAPNAGFNEIRAACQQLIADGYAAKRVITQFAERLVDDDALDELRRSRALLVLADTDHALVEGADEYLQLLNAMAQTLNAMKN
eukprot:TRINITY_DN4925_c0_g1_i1.p2 TRINITY_DN4925_c0_g1~~TRINITY_DN4925_c0_g1_i1.p2  ORF type:complete len:226 (+),score=111.50 TRINITY_DN4925_c0_g1_i1:435-1112(+)